VKEVIEFKQAADGKTIKIVKKVKIYKKKVLLNKRVEDRAKWRKFGACAGLPAGLEPGVTYFGDEVTLVPVRKREGDAEADAAADPTGIAAGKQVESGITCRNCGAVGDHWTTKCPLKGKIQPAEDLSYLDRDDGPARPGGAPGKYVPPGQRRGDGGREGSRFDERDDATTVRVTNLSEDTSDQDLAELFRPFGLIQRVFVAKDRETGLAKGFAFVNFVRRADAAKAIEKLNGIGWNNLILNMEWAKPSQK